MSVVSVRVSFTCVLQYWLACIAIGHCHNRIDKLNKKKGLVQHANDQRCLTMAPRFSFALLFATIAWLAARLHGSAVELATDGSGFADDDRWLNDGTYNFDTSYCNIPRFGNVSRREFATRIMGKTPAILSINRTRNAEFARLTERNTPAPSFSLAFNTGIASLLVNKNSQL